MKYSVKFSETAKQNISDIHKYISNQLENPESANKIVKDIITKGNSLSLFPKSSISRLCNNKKIIVPIAIITQFFIQLTREP